MGVFPLKVCFPGGFVSLVGLFPRSFVGVFPRRVCFPGCWVCYPCILLLVAAPYGAYTCACRKMMSNSVFG